MTRPSPDEVREALEYYSDTPPFLVVLRGPHMPLIFAAARAYLDGEAWQPIETAPKDGTHIILGRAGDEDTLPVATVGWWEDAEEDGPDYMGADAGFVDYPSDVFLRGRSFGNPAYQRAGVQPTHWRPLPAPPEST